jgi:hypothetical protein
LNWRRLLAGPVLVLAVAAPGRADDDAGAVHAARACPTANIKSIAQNRYVSVYRFVRGRHRDESESCVRATGARTLLNPTPGDLVFTSPRPALDRYTVAFVLDESLPEGEAQTLWVIDARGNGFPNGEANRQIEPGAGRAIHLVVQANGAVAWSAASRTVRRIYRQNSDESEPRLLARSSRVDPESLTRKGDAIVWRESGRTRRASLR